MAINTQGCMVKLGNTASPIVYTEISGVTDFSGFSGSRSVIDITTLASSGREKQTGIPDYGQVTFNAIYRSDADGDTTHDALYDLFQSGLARTFQMVFDDSPQEVFTFSAFVLNFQFNTGIDEVVRISVTLEVTGTPTDNNT